jgi:tRNA nucleotidyltransferase (CCA-adding enzyme)
VEGNIIDPFDGQADLEASVVRAVGDPRERFAEDGLRVLRAARFAATLECAIDPDTERAMGEERSIATFRRVSAERVRDEWLKTMRARRPSVAFEGMRRTSILGVTCPELIESVGCAQDKPNAHDVWGHAMARLDACAPDPILRVAALFQDLGKPRTRAFSDATGDYTFEDHDKVGAAMADAILARLRFSNEERERIVALVRHHLVGYTRGWSDASVRRWVRRVGKSLVPDLHLLGVANALGRGCDAREEIALREELKARVEAVLAAGIVLSPRDLAIRGSDLMSTLGLPPGRAVGEILAALVEVVTDEPAMNTRDRLIEQARRIAAEQPRP